MQKSAAEHWQIKSSNILNRLHRSVRLNLEHEVGLTSKNQLMSSIISIDAEKLLI